jgi:trimeric autotransporter adhesin
LVPVEHGISPAGIIDPGYTRLTRFLASTDRRDFSKLCAMKTRVPTFLTIFSLTCFVLSPKAQAVSPPPDGGYAGGNTAEGQNALLSLTTGTYNTALGLYSLLSDSTGKFNTAVGAGTLLVNTADENTATGAGALLSNTTGTENAALGTFSLFNNTSGSFNTATGSQVLFANTTGTENTANGTFALNANTEGSFNTAIGAFALADNTSGSENTAMGVNALFSNTAGGNTGIGANALRANTTGFQNTAVGHSALFDNIVGTFNTAIGASALTLNTGDGNTACGNVALFNNTGSNNTAVGNGAGTNLTTGNNNIDIGYIVGGVAGESNTIRIGNSDITATFITGISGATASGGAAVFVNSNGKLGTSTSSVRFKEDIKPMGKASEAILALKPVSFRYKKEIDPQGIAEFGLIAEEVEKINPDLIIRDREGKPQTVRYEQVNAMLLNEFLKEHAKVQRLEAALEAVNERLKEQEAKIDKVSGQIEFNRSAPQMVANH